MCGELETKIGFCEATSTVDPRQASTQVLFGESGTEAGKEQQNIFTSVKPPQMV